MGNSTFSRHLFEADVTPAMHSKPTFDLNLGFPSGREARVMVATEAEMEAAMMPLEDRDYCAHKYIEFCACRAQNSPIISKCRHKQHEYALCEFEDYVLRLKEFERERRLRIRQKKRAQKENTEVLAY